jgi:hypothetical protein
VVLRPAGLVSTIVVPRGPERVKTLVHVFVFTVVVDVSVLSSAAITRDDTVVLVKPDHVRRSAPTRVVMERDPASDWNGHLASLGIRTRAATPLRVTAFEAVPNACNRLRSSAAIRLGGRIRVGCPGGLRCAESAEATMLRQAAKWASATSHFGVWYAHVTIATITKQHAT